MAGDGCRHYEANVSKNRLFEPQHYQFVPFPTDQLLALLKRGYTKVDGCEVPIEVRKVLPETIVTLHASISDRRSREIGPNGYRSDRSKRPPVLLRTKSPIDAFGGFFSNGEYMIYDNSIVMDMPPLNDDRLIARFTICHPGYRLDLDDTLERAKTLEIPTGFARTKVLMRRRIA
ncbi:MAG: hypothetical protein AAB774_01615 [Patescibacteria group bacterium]